MGQSIVNNYIHLVWSTKHRESLITAPYNHELYSFMGGVCRGFGCQPISIGGYRDHIHILCRLSQKITLMKLVEQIKSRSSKWIKSKDETLKNFYWQKGYAAFSVDPSRADGLVRYIENQQQRHTGQMFKDEYLELLKLHNIDYDETYLWD